MLPNYGYCKIIALQSRFLSGWNRGFLCSLREPERRSARLQGWFPKQDSEPKAGNARSPSELVRPNSTVVAGGQIALRFSAVY